MSSKIAAAVVAVLTGAVGFLPLFGGPGYEHAIASGIVLPSAAAIATALDSVARPSAPLETVGRGVANGLLLAAVSFATALLHGLRVGICDLPGGAFTFGMTAGIGAVMGGVWGAIAGHAAAHRSRPRLFAVLGALAAPLGGIALSVWRFVATPIVFAFDPFFGYFSGTLYDTVIDAGTPLVTYRIGSLAVILAVILFASVVRAPRGAASLARAALGAICGAVAIGIALEAHALGHWQSAASITEALGATKSGPRCTTVYPDGTREDDAELMLRDCEEEIAAVEAALGAHGPERITAFFFRDAAEKKRLMGAGDTYIAKPWRREVYLQVHAYPHPVLGHEIAHVVAGAFGRGPFRVAGDLGGLWPNPGLIEGVAVAASPDDDDLTDAQWARAMMDQGIIPPMRRVFSMGFLGDTAAKSYTIAGAFVRWTMKTYGAETVRAWYGGASIEELTKSSWEGLDAAFRRSLAAEALPPEAAAVARAKFGKPGIFGRVCPHVVDGIRQEADRCRDQGQYARAVDLYGDALRRDAHDFASLVARGTVEQRWRDEAKGRSALEALANDPAAPRTWRDRAEEAIADVDLLDGRLAQAAAAYRAIAARSLDEDFARNLEVKAIAATDDAARPAIEALLLGSRRRPSDVMVGAAELGAWSAATKAPLADYLLGRNFAQRGWWALAAEHLDRAVAAGAPLPSVGREALRQRATVACVLRDRAAMDRVRAAIVAPGNPFERSAGGRRASIDALLARCEGR
jgi:hypothetical protein